MIILSASKLKKTFKTPEPVQILSGISLDIHAGESIAITGRSGEGKTTLLHILGTLEPFDSGELIIAGKPAPFINSSQGSTERGKVSSKRSGLNEEDMVRAMTDEEDRSSKAVAGRNPDEFMKGAGKPFQSNGASKFRNSRIGFIFQAFNLLEDFTALENVLMPARIARKPFDREKGNHLLSLVGLKHRANFPTKLLSGGERQRVAIARSLCNDPDLLFADEPSGNLDHANADAVSNLLFDLVRASQKTLILVTHDMDLAARCDRQFCLSQGKLY